MAEPLLDDAEIVPRGVLAGVVLDALAELLRGLAVASELGERETVRRQRERIVRIELGRCASGDLGGPGLAPPRLGDREVVESDLWPGRRLRARLSAPAAEIPGGREAVCGGGEPVQAEVRVSLLAEHVVERVGRLGPVAT